MLIQAERLSLGNIFVVGSLRGIAHAGYYGDSDAVIAASVMNPMQLRISDVAMRAPKEDGAEAGENVRILMRTITLLSIACNFSLILDLI